MDNGYIKLHRKVKNSKVWYYTDAQFKVFITILTSVNWTESWARHKGEEVKLKPGQMVTSRNHLVEESGTSKKVVRDTLTKLEKDEIIKTVRSSDGTLLTVLNWQKYQEIDNDRASDEGNNEGNNEGIGEGIGEGTHEEVKEHKEVKEKNTSPESGDSEDLDKESLRERFGERPVKFTDRMIDAVKGVNERASTPEPGTVTYKNWVQAFDRLNRLGPSGGDKGYSWEELEEILNWTFQDEFWSENVASPIQLRKKGNNGNSKIVNIENSMPDNSGEWEEI